MRSLKDGWMRAYRDYVSNQESPDIFHFWIAMQVIAGALKRNVWINRGAYTLYPNMYVFLITKSGSCRKSVAMEIGTRLLSNLEEVAMLYERASLEGLMDRMQRVSLMPDGKILPDGSLFIHADELADLFGKASYITDLMSFLTAAYSSRSRLDFLTRNKGLCSVRNPCPSILSGTTPEQFGEIFPSTTLSSGFLGRVLIIVGERGKKISDPSLKKELEEPLIHDLKEISKLYGEFKLTNEAKASFKRWYESMPSTCEHGFQAFYERKHDHVLKAALLLSAAEGDTKIITETHFKQALEAIEFLESSLGEATEFIGATHESYLAETIYSMIKHSHPEPLGYSVIMRRIYKRLKNKEEFRGILDGLIDAEKIKEIASGKGIAFILRI